MTLGGLTAPVEVVRDRNAVPHIYADSAEDALFALGYVHAQDRLFQMDFQRRVGAGRLSEVLGEATLENDKFLRTLGVYRVAERTLPNLSAETQGALDAYAGGVNAFLEGRRGALPPEFSVLGYKPEPWTPTDSLVWLKMMAWDLGGNWDDELLRARLLEVLPPERVAELWPPYPWGRTRGAAGLFGALQKAAVRTRSGPSRPNRCRRGPGQITGWSTGAKALRARRCWRTTPTWRCKLPRSGISRTCPAPGLEVTGATLPGLPLVVLGRTDRFAWGFTNTGPDTQDLFIEKLHPRDPERYRTPDGWAYLRLREEIIRVKGQAGCAAHRSARPGTGRSCRT